MNKSNETVVRILEIKLKNYKNISKGIMETADVFNIKNNMVDIRGIYGQNGSGKTSIISAVGIIKRLFMGKSLPEDVHEYIMIGKNESEIEILFFIKKIEKEYKVKYNVIISKREDISYIRKESIHYWENIDDKWNKQKGLIDNDNNENFISPKYRNDEIQQLYEEVSDFLVNKKMMFKAQKSFIFSNELVSNITDKLVKTSPEYEVIDILKTYAISNLFIIDNKQLALSDANILLPMNFKNYKGEKKISAGVMPIGLENPTYMPKQAINEINTSLMSTNKVLNEIIPDLTIKLKELSVQVSESGKEEVQVELFSCRNSAEIPIRYESDGIKKIVAILHLLIAMFNYNTMTVLIDEIDSGIFEYLLGELLEIIEERGKGQLIFTSHNLRPLEILNKNNLVFTTVNPDNRYIKLKNIKTNNNLRDMYYRDLILGGQDEVIYDRTNSAQIARAFRKAGE